MPFQRASGILLHPTSLPGRFGIGDLGPEAYRFIDFLAATKQQLWQVLPLGPTGYGNSPYLCYSAMAGNPLLISLEMLCDRSLLYPDELHELEQMPRDRVDFEAVVPVKMRLLERAASRFDDVATEADRAALAQFSEDCHFWVDEYAFFMALKNAHGGAAWTEWPEPLARRQPEAMAEWREKLASDFFCHKFLQFEFHCQWQALRDYARDRQVQIIGDIPIYVAHDSVDVWAFPENFKLDEQTLAPALMAGVPPDYFSATGQLWGNPTYNWDELQARDFDWWIQRIRALLDYVDIIRVDHFRGLQAYWAVPAGETTAINGEWIEAPGEALFDTVLQSLSTLPIMAEDLGVITPEVEALRDKYEFPGMKILHFAFGGGSDNPYLPFNYSANSVVYTGTHDNDTTLGWYEQAPDYERDRLLDYVGCLSPEGVHWTLIRLALMSVANQAIIPLQDVLGYGTDCRMNTPGQAEGNWAWRYRAEALTDEIGDRLRRLTELSNRAPWPVVKAAPEEGGEG